ncbi:spindle assembly abnormal protein 6 homolog isoform X1 [Hyalella azteca]|uniref:Spindle assembly abnormal protein 6 homolog isoform X1 n=1 Tax=Hyalella azteca TaxID=294128 RepID=A0A8B7P2H9_HYAAZ|nr:spindle assembly abnormal protein 6 homolog isoform X1 [Hyalella azteca]
MASSVTELCCLDLEVQLLPGQVDAGASVAQNRKLTFTITLNIKPNLPQTLCVWITDADDPQVLLTSCVSAADYPSLKAAQGLLVDFQSFQQHLIQLLQSCQQQQHGQLQPRMGLVLSGCGAVPGLLGETAGHPPQPGGVMMQMVEHNSFRRLCHLEMAVVPAATATKLPPSLGQVGSSSRDQLLPLRDLLHSSNMQTISALQARLDAHKQDINNIMAKLDSRKEGINALRADLDSCKQDVNATDSLKPVVNATVDLLKQAFDEVFSMVINSAMQDVITTLHSAKQDVITSLDPNMQDVNRLDSLFAMFDRITAKFALLDSIKHGGEPSSQFLDAVNYLKEEIQKIQD